MTEHVMLHTYLDYFLKSIKGIEIIIEPEQGQNIAKAPVIIIYWTHIRDPLIPVQIKHTSPDQ